MTAASFCQAIGQWKGTAEVFDGQGRFLGNAVDQRHVTTELGDDRVRIELSFTGPFKFAGHYVIADHGKHRHYEGPVNLGFAETLGDNIIQADNYWPQLGLSQRFFLSVLPGGNKQLSMALLSRGERLCYAVLSEHDRVGTGAACATEEGEGPEIPGFLPGASIDLGHDPAAGRGQILMHREGSWGGTVSVLDGELNTIGAEPYQEEIRRTGESLHVRLVGGGFAPEPSTLDLHTDGWQAWTGSGDMVGSYSLSGGRGLSGQFYRTREKLRVWRREVVSHDGSLKVVVHNWYRGSERIGVQQGVLSFEGP